MNSENCKTSDPYRLVFYLTDIQSKRYVALSNLNIY